MKHEHMKRGARTFYLVHEYDHHNHHLAPVLQALQLLAGHQNNVRYER
jgi:hypothetical protein